MLQVTFDYTMDGTSTSGAPSAGYIILNNSTQSSATAMHVDDADDDGNSLDAFFTAMSTVNVIDEGAGSFDEEVQMLGLFSLRLRA